MTQDRQDVIRSRFEEFITNELCFPAVYLERSGCGAYKATHMCALWECYQAAYAARQGEVERYRKALEKAKVAMNDWVVCHASDMVGEKAIADTASRVGKLGHLAYIAEIVEEINAALSQNNSEGV